MIFLILFFCLDIIIFMLFKKFLVQTVLSYFITRLILLPEEKNNFKKLNLIFIIFFIFLEDLILNQRVGLSLIYLIPITFFIFKIKNHLIWITRLIIFGLSLLFINLIEFILIKNVILGQNITVYSTFINFFVNLIIGYLVLLGIQGNRANKYYFNKY